MNSCLSSFSPLWVCRNWHLSLNDGCRGFIGPVPLPLLMSVLICGSCQSLYRGCLGVNFRQLTLIWALTPINIMMRAVACYLNYAALFSRGIFILALMNVSLGRLSARDTKRISSISLKVACPSEAAIWKRTSRKATRSSGVVAS